MAKICSQHRVPMIPYGSGTSLEGHTTAPGGGVVIDISRMNSVKAVHEADMDVVVEPGITWNDLNDQLKQYHLFYPVGSPTQPHTTRHVEPLGRLSPSSALPLVPCLHQQSLACLHRRRTGSDLMSDCISAYPHSTLHPV